MVAAAGIWRRPAEEDEKRKKQSATSDAHTKRSKRAEHRGVFGFIPRHDAEQQRIVAIVIPFEARM